MKTMRSCLTPSFSDTRYDWLYRQNPHGRARAWLAQNLENGDIVGVSAAFKREACAQGSERSGWILGDFCIADTYRSLGPALQLQKATLTALGNLGDAQFCYDFPSRSLMAIYQRLGVQASAHLVRMAKPLRIPERSQRFTGLKALDRPAAKIGDLLLRVTDYGGPSRHGWEIAIHETECDHEFTELWETTLAENNIRIQRTAEYLNWRYLRHPLVGYQILTARKAGALRGYLVFSVGDDNAEIADWCCGGDDRLVMVLVQDLVRRLRKTATTTLSTFLLDSDPGLGLFKRMGFWHRESSPVVMHWLGSTPAPPVDWRLLRGDRDL
ncbi:MAG: hypothetical protein ACM3SW_10640 [Actinomycetota bacterium]